MILIDFSNNETIEFPNLSSAFMYVRDLCVIGIKALAIHCSDTEDFRALENYILELNNSIN
jgi:hypothetical protein